MSQRRGNGDVSEKRYWRCLREEVLAMSQRRGNGDVRENQAFILIKDKPLTVLTQ